MLLKMCVTLLASAFSLQVVAIQQLAAKSLEASLQTSFENDFASAADLEALRRYGLTISTEADNDELQQQLPLKQEKQEPLKSTERKEQKRQREEKTRQRGEQTQQRDEKTRHRKLQKGQNPEQTEDENEQEASAVKIVLGQDIDYPPYADGNSTNLMGFGKDIADGMTALCENLEIEVVEVRWSDCWSSAGGGTLGAKLDDASSGIDACMTYTHTQGARNQYAEFSYGILDEKKGAGLLSLLDVNGQPKVTGQDDLSGKTVVVVGGWAPTADGLGFVTNKCTEKKYSDDRTVLTGNGNDESLRMLLDGTADAMFVYSDEAYEYNKLCQENPNQAWDCSIWSGFGTKFAYVQTGQFGYVVNGTTLALAKKGSGVAEKLNPCLATFMRTKAYYEICVKNDLTSSCYKNEYFSASEEEVKPYNQETDEHTSGCLDGYCPCTSKADNEELQQQLPLKQEKQEPLKSNEREEQRRQKEEKKRKGEESKK